MSKLICIFLVLFISKAHAQSSAGEDSLSLNGEWSFKTDPYGTGEKYNWHKPALDEASAWEIMQVPSNWDTKNEYAHYTGQAWYRKKLNVPAAWKGRTLRLLFEAVYHDSKVWLNGTLLGTNNSGFLPFGFDVSKLINYDGDNTIVVSADNTFRRGAIWNWGGIRRPVVLVAKSPVHVSSQFISPSYQVQKGTADVRIKAFIQNNDNSPAEVQGDIILAATNGFKRSLPFTLTVQPNSLADISVSAALNKNEVHPWNFDDPFMYSSEVILRKEGREVHRLNDRFGLRKIEVDHKNFTFKLNGEPIRVMGFNLVPDDRTNGNTLPLWRVKEDIDMMKSFGANMARLTHLPMHKEMFDYLDEKGIMVYSEIPLWGFDQLADKNSPLPKEWLKRLITDNYNHPCIIGWGVGNEIGDYPNVMGYVDDAIKYVRTLDTTRMAIMVSHTAQKSPDPIQYSDIGLINKYGTGIGTLAGNIHKLHPGKLLFYAEYGYSQFTEDLDGDLNAKGMLDSLRFRPYLMGGALWTFNDYRSNFIATKEVSENRPWGIVNVFRQKKRAYFSFRKEYAPVRDLRVEKVVTGSSGSASIIISPRKILDLPAYNVNGYAIIWKAAGPDKKIIRGGITKLPVIRPGDKDLLRSIRWQGAGDLSSLSVELLSPLNYSVYDTTIFLQKPTVPEIVYASGVRTEMNNVTPNSGGIRVVFRKDATATAYKARYGRDGLTNETALTLNHFIDIPRLAFNETYQVSVVAVNTAGESQSEIKNVLVGMDYAPPVITYTEPADKGFFVGYPSMPDDYLYKLQYSTVKGDFSNAQQLQSVTKGVLFVPGLENGKSYFYRMKRLKHNTYESSWSEEINVMPDGGVLPAPPVVHGILHEGNEAVICFTPVKKAIGYIVQYRGAETDKWISMQINAAQTEHVIIKNLHRNKSSYQFRMACINQYGQSAFTEAFRVIK